MSLFRDHVAIVTGAGGGIGKAIARSLGGEHGATVCLVGRTRAKLEAARQELGPGAPSAVVLPTDLTIDAQMDTLVHTVERDLGGTDILVLCAGEIAEGPIREVPVEEMDRLYRSNVRANYRLVRALLHMLKKRPGQIAFINSSSGLGPRPNVSQFSATQHALRAFADALRAEVNSDGIRVLSVYPGRTATPRQEALYQTRRSGYQPDLLLQPEDVASVVVNALALPPTAEVTDISIRPRVKSY
ncbi:MAG TPA: SDR family NAD(P)-dependent oxidoreductase [Candidatus Eisenbacteria bacterium]|nr:SDR family NAD(P)-dependent oxidoreductase [Candidatus Eisenbacteria bacterium]